MPAKDETFIFSRSRPIPQKGSDPLNQTELLFPLIFISLEDDSSIVIPPQPTSPGEIMSGGEGEPVEADVPAEDETVSPQGTHVTGTQTVTHEYLTLNGKVARETIKTNNSLTAVLDFIYDESGKPFALKYSTDGATFDTYYYVLNLQGDVVKLIQANGHVVAQYTYDAWGNILDSGGDLAAVNPLRYRGYYYDNETGFYYLQSRYYDPANRRFINADNYQSTGQGFVGTNMFAYCNNSPVDLYDQSGNAAGKSFLTVMEDCAGGRPRELDPNGIYQYAPSGTEALLLYESPYDSRANLTRKVKYLSPTQTRICREFSVLQFHWHKFTRKNVGRYCGVVFTKLYRQIAYSGTRGYTYSSNYLDANLSTLSRINPCPSNDRNYE